MPFCSRKNLLVVLLATSLTSQAFGQAGYVCEQINRGNFEEIPFAFPSVCANIIDYDVGIPLGSTQKTIESSLAALSLINSAISESCQIAVNTALCTSAYPKCTANDEVQATACQDLCLSLSMNCNGNDKAVLDTLGLSSQLQCDDTTTWSTQPSCNFGPSQKIDKTKIQTPSCVAYSGSVCAGNVPGHVYIPAGLNANILEAAAAAQQFSFALTPRSTGCDRLHQAWVCANTFHHCAELPIPGLSSKITLTVPRPACHSFCEEYNAACEPFFASSDSFRHAFQPTCDATTESGSVYPVDTIPVINSNDGLVVVECTNWSSIESPTITASAVTQINAICHYPLAIPDEFASSEVPRIADGACALSCPFPLFTMDQFDVYGTILNVGSSLSLIATAFYGLTWLLFRKERKTPYYLYMNLCLMVFYFVVLVGSIRTSAIGARNMNESQCKNNVEEIHFEGFCLGQGIVALFAVLTAMSWWLIQAADIFRTLVLDVRAVEGSILHRNILIGYHIFGWVPPLIAVIFVLAKKSFGGVTIGLGWCFTTSGRDPAPGALDIDLAVVYLPMIIYIAIGTTLMIAVMLRILFLGAQVDFKNKSCLNRFMCHAHLRIFLFLFTMLTLWCYLFALKMFTNERTSEIKAVIEEFVMCSLIDGPLTGADCQARYVDGQIYTNGLMIGFQLIVSLCGFLCYVFHAASYSAFRLWMQLFYDLGLTCCPSLSQSCCRRYSASNVSNSTPSNTPRTGSKEKNSKERANKERNSKDNASGTAVTESNSNHARKPSLFKKTGLRASVQTTHPKRSGTGDSDSHPNNSDSQTTSGRSGTTEMERQSHVELEMVTMRGSSKKVVFGSSTSKVGSQTGSYFQDLNSHRNGSVAEAGGSRFMSTPFRGWDVGSYGGSVFEEHETTSGVVTTIASRATNSDSDSEDQEERVQNVPRKVRVEKRLSSANPAHGPQSGSHPRFMIEEPEVVFEAEEEGEVLVVEDNNDDDDLSVRISTVHGDENSVNDANVALDDNAGGSFHKN